MPTCLKTENPGVCLTEGFILLRATSKRLTDNDSPYTIGQFGSGNKHAVNVLLRAKLYSPSRSRARRIRVRWLPKVSGPSISTSG